MIYIYIGCQYLSECFKKKDAELCYVLHSVFVIIMSEGERPSVYLTPGYHKQFIYITVCVCVYRQEWELGTGNLRQDSPRIKRERKPTECNPK